MMLPFDGVADIAVNRVLVVKWLHVLSSTLLFGTGVGTAFYLFFISRTRDLHAIAVIATWVVVADWLFTATTIVLQPLTGFWLAHLMGYPLHSRWIVWSSVLLAIAAACWLPVLWLQLRLRDVARTALAEGETGVPPAYIRLLRAWTALGVPALIAFLAIFYLMVARPM